MVTRKCKQFVNMLPRIGSPNKGSQFTKNGKFKYAKKPKN
jgi:hypothetical protein